MNFFIDQRREHYAKARSYVSVFKVQRNIFLAHLTKFNQLDNEFFHQIKDELLLERRYEILNEGCEICDQFGHFAH